SSMPVGLVTEGTWVRWVAGLSALIRGSVVMRLFGCGRALTRPEAANSAEEGRTIMRRRTFDIIVSSVGAVLVVVLAAAGALAMWGYSFANTSVRAQLVAQQIYSPPAGSDALKSPEIGPYLNQYAGQQLTTGAQAEAYADHFIAVHLREVADGKTYAQVSSEAQANPKDTALAAQANTLFKGEALRSMLLEAYAFWQIGEIALWAAITSFILGGLMLLLTVFGVIHLRRVDPAAELLPDKRETLQAATA